MYVAHELGFTKMRASFMAGISDKFIFIQSKNLCGGTSFIVKNQEIRFPFFFLAVYHSWML